VIASNPAGVVTINVCVVTARTVIVSVASVIVTTPARRVSIALAIVVTLAGVVTIQVGVVTHASLKLTTLLCVLAIALTEVTKRTRERHTDVSRVIRAVCTESGRRTKMRGSIGEWTYRGADSLPEWFPCWRFEKVGRPFTSRIKCEW
jgi:hypothetical protein